MVRSGHGAVSLAYLRGERSIRSKKLVKVNMEDLTPEQEREVREEARLTGNTFHECAARVLANQKKLDDYEV